MSEEQNPYENYIRPQHSSIEVTEVDADGKTVVRKKLSLRELRKRFTICVTLLVLGVTILGFWGPINESFFAPGPLSSSHAQLLSTTGNTAPNRCVSCHDAGSNSPLAWFADTISGGRHYTTPQSEKCMECHDQTLNADFALTAHNVDQSWLNEITQEVAHKFANNPKGNFNFQMSHHLKDDVACSTCHREHHGSNHDLSFLTDQQCQTCHSNQFNSFANGHPEFGDWTTRVSLGIEFDHYSHSAKHFSSKGATFDCKSCHQTSEDGQTQLVTSFEKSCANCHDATIKGTLSKGIELVRLPIIDPEVFAAAGKPVGSWPETATGDFDGEIPPLMKALLVADPNAKSALDELGREFNFFDLDTEDRSQVQSAANLVIAIKQLLNDLGDNPRQSLTKRLQLTLGESASEGFLNSLQFAIDDMPFADTKATWFPNLEKELLSQNVSGSPIRLVSYQETGKQKELLLPNPLKGKFGSSGSTTTPNQSANNTNSLPSAIQSKPPQTVQNPSTQPKPTTENAASPKRFELKQGSTAQSGDPSLLIENPLKGYGQSNIEVKSPPKESQVSDTNQTQQPNKQTPETNSSLPTGPTRLTKMINVDKMQGWVRDDLVCSISYKPSGHADPFVKAWMEWTSRNKESENSITRNLEKNFNNVSTTGYCLSCHQTKNNTVSWKASYRNEFRREFTKFSHQPHLLQPQLRDCTSCHVMDETKGGTQTENVVAKASQAAESPKPLTHVSTDDPAMVKLASFVQTLEVSDVEYDESVDPSLLNSPNQCSDFHAIEKSNCVTCHQPSAVSQSCTQCHNYHIGAKR